MATCKHSEQIKSVPDELINNLPAFIIWHITQLP